MSPQRISIKLFVAGSARVDLAAMIPVFHGWIQQAKVPGMPIDVADYRHMTDGPGVMLIGRDVDYALEMTDGRPGLTLTRKGNLTGDLGRDLAMLFHAALAAGRMLEEDTALKGQLRFRTDEFVVMLRDRLRTPNDAATFERVRDSVTACFAAAQEGAAVTLERDAADDRQCLTIRVTTPDAPDLPTLETRLGTTPLLQADG